MLIDERVLQETEKRLAPLIPAQLRERASVRKTLAPAPGRADLVKAYVAGKRAATDENAFERAVGDIDLVGVDYLYNGLRAAEAVARVVIPRADGNRTAYATGFMVSPDLFLTNWHVFKTADAARLATAQFGYQADADGAERVSTSFMLRPDRFFLADEHLDYCLVAVDPTSEKGPSDLRSFGWLRLNPDLGKADVGQWASVIQHPGGQLKQLAIRENAFLPIDEDSDFLSYHSDTLRGSSGAPVLNDFWEVVALHHSGVAAKDAQGRYLDHQGNPIVGRDVTDEEVKWIANEGARVSRIVADALNRAAPSALRESFEQVVRGRLESTATPDFGLAQGPFHGGAAGAVTLASRQQRFFLPVDVLLSAGDVVADAAVAGAAALGRAATSMAPQADFELVFDDDYSNRTGYVATFLGRRRSVSMPTVAYAAAALVAPTLDGAKQLDYHHFSVVMHARRRLAIFTAGNVDYVAEDRDQRSRKEFGKDQWRLDPRMAEEYQIPKKFYDRWKKLDYGHLVRREDNLWGSSDEQREFANSDTFHMTNCSPQHEAFNRSNLDGLWGNLEETIKAQAADEGQKIGKLCVFCGPVFDDRKDLVCGDVRVPLAFWKVVVAPAPGNKIKAYGFILKQAKVLNDDPPFEEFDPSGYERSFATLKSIEARTLVRFGTELKAADVLKGQ
ncbi:MAG: DNA/RNA non-specific endonuclease [Rhodocyclales bacterium]|nr:DNA/RNA non-specific endonuclease [Rhodocyclales bacterium]